MKVKKSDGTWATLYTKPIGDTLPVGSISAYGGENIPTNWLKCNGEAISRTDYPDLFKAIGTTYGRGDGSTTFNLPDLSERVVVGNAGDGEFSLGNTGGEKTHTLKINEMPRHNHAVNYWVNHNLPGGIDHFLAYGNTSSAKPNRTQVDSWIEKEGGDQPHNNMQPYIALNFIIKAKQSVGLVGNVVSDINAQGDNDVASTKVIKKYVDDHAGSANIIKTGITDPNTETVGDFVGQIYCNTRKDTAYQLVSITKIDGETYYNWTKLVRGNDKVTSLSSNSTDEQYPSAKAVKDYVDKKQTYSTKETVIGTWIDGKPIYRKVYEINSLPNKERMYVDCNIPNVQHVITMRGVMESSTEWDSMPSAYTNGTLIDSLVIERTGNTLTRIRILNNFDRSKFSAFVILEYTKTID